MTGSPAAGRALTPKGEARRDALLDAVVRVLERSGPAAVTHRAVATEAGVPVAAATYYFATLDDLFVSALTRATESQLALFAELSNGSFRDFAVALHQLVYSDRASAIAQYELLLLAMRRDGLREAAERWYSTLELAIISSCTVARPDLAASAIDGLVLRMLWRAEPASVDDIEVALRYILD